MAGADFKDFLPAKNRAATGDHWTTGTQPSFHIAVMAE